MTVRNDLDEIRSSQKKIGRDLLKRKIRVFGRNKLAVFGLVVILIFLVGAVFAQWIAPYDPFEPNFPDRLVGPSLTHIFGTDTLGRDLFSRLLYGARNSLAIALTSALAASSIGVIFGAIGGYFGGWIDKLLVHFSELINCIPQIILVLVLTSLYTSNVLTLIFIFGITGWTGTFRLVRTDYIALREETYVKVCEAFGMSKLKIMFKGILPSALTSAIIQLTMSIPSYVMSEASLSFLGFGVPKSVTTWGTMLNAANSTRVLLYYPCVWMVPGIAIVIFILAINFFGDGLRDVLDPHQM